MIYLHNTKHLQRAYIPVNGAAPQGTLSLHLHGNVSEADTEVAVAWYVGGRQYVRVTWRFADKLDKGEYRYELRSADALVSEGLAQVGEYEDRSNQYNTTTKYRQYGAKQ